MGFRINNVFLSHSKHDMNKGLMNGRTTMKLFGLFGLLIVLYCGCADRHRHKPFCEQELVDSLEVRVQDSLFSNVLIPVRRYVTRWCKCKTHKCIIVCSPFMVKPSLFLLILTPYFITIDRLSNSPAMFPSVLAGTMSWPMFIMLKETFGCS